MAGDVATPHVVEDFFGVVRLLSDGSIVRGDETVLMPVDPVPDVPCVEWKDAVYHAARGLKVRVYRPTPAAAADGGGSTKLPVLVHFHGGGYCLGSYDQAGWSDYFRQRLAADLPAVVLSVQYRLAPENRLPAAIEDGAAFLAWLRGQAVLGAGAEPWLAESADFAGTLVSGVSAGANLAHHLAVQVGSGQIELHPARLAGYVLLSAFFGGVERTATEADPPARRVPDRGDVRPALAHGAARGGYHGPLAGEPVRPGQPRPSAGGAAPGARRGARARRAPRPRAALRGEAEGDGEGRGARRVRGGAPEQHGFSVRGWGQANEELVRILKQFVVSW